MVVWEVYSFSDTPILVNPNLGHINYPPVIKHSNVTFPLNVRYSIAMLHYRSVTKTEILISRWCGEEEERAVQSAWLVLIEEFNRLVI
jgi:hypothetical protein